MLETVKQIREIYFRNNRVMGHAFETLWRRMAPNEQLSNLLAHHLQTSVLTLPIEKTRSCPGHLV